MMPLWTTANSQFGSDLIVHKFVSQTIASTTRMEHTPVRMAIKTRRLAVSGPPSVCNAGVRIKHLFHVDAALLDEQSEFGDLANLLERKHLILLVAIDCQAGGVVAAVLKPGES